MSGEPARTVGPVSVAVCNWQGERYLPALLDSLAAQTLPPAEVLVVDNASTDGGLALVRERWPEVRVVELAENRGPAPARNAGMRAAAHRWVLALDNDVVLAPDCLERLVRAAERDPRLVALEPRSVFAGEPDRVHYDGAELHFAGLFALRNFYAPLADAAGEGTVPVGGVVSLALLVDRDALLAEGGYDERGFILFEDLDLSYRLRARGHALASVEDALVRHAEGTEGLSFRGGPRYPARRVFLHARNRWTYLLTCYRARTLVLAAPGLLCYEAASLAFALRAGAPGAWCAGRWAALRGLRETLARRRAVQRTRAVGDRELLVAGPLTVTPAAAASGPRGRALRVLDALLSAWWRLVRPLVR